MSLYCVKIKYSLEAIKGMMEDGLDRAEAMRNLTEKLGGKLSFLWYGRTRAPCNGYNRGA